MKVSVAIIQFRPLLGKRDENISKLSGLIDQVKWANLIVLPELASTGYNFPDFEEAYACSEVLHDSPFVEFLIGKAGEKNAFIVTGINERAGTQLYNSAILVGPEGIAGKYRKIHLFMNEKDIFRRGDAGLPVFDIGICKVGMLICFDYLFPEIWRIQAMKGADIICHPANLLTQNAHRCVPGLAIMNRVFILTANRTGTEGNLTFNGQSIITDPSGEVIARASVEGDEILTAELDTGMARNKWITLRNHAFDDRCPELYL